MEDTKKFHLLEDIQTDSAYRPIRNSLKPLPFYMQERHQNLFDSEIENNFQLYKYVIYIYLMINGVQLVRNAFDLHSSPAITFKKVAPIVIYLLSIFVWLYGRLAHASRNPKKQFRFQGLLIVLMVYSVYVCANIIGESYIALPNLTMSSFGLNAIFGILIPVLVYYRADELRRIFETKNHMSLFKA